MELLSARALTSTLRFTADLAKSVGDRIAKNAVRQIRVSFKGEVDLVTQFDKQAQDLIVNAMTEEYPEYGVLSEENVSTGKGRPVRWIVDPLDGTTNFAHGLPIWAISIALEVEKAVVLGVVYDPTRKEIFTAIINRGARLNGRRIYVSTTRKIGHSLLVTGFPYDIRRTKNNNLRQFGAFAVRARAVRRLGSAALDLCYTACGRFDGYWELKLSPWDQAAGSLILREAGGRVTDFAGRKFSIYGDEVLGTNGLIHGQMMSVLKRRRG
ncbi:MAG: inositol monophosphatase [candidate division WOR-3 bacterium]|nr:MAG: inositol monophosphatase [candidate division WOR-3 bacterium]